MPPFFAVLEHTKKDWPHLHIWFPGRKYLQPQAKLQSMWGAIVDVRHASGRAAYYVSKYIRKGSTAMHLLWKAKARQYSVSNSMKVAKQQKPTAGWSVLGCVTFSWGIESKAMALSKDFRLATGVGPDGFDIESTLHSFLDELQHYEPDQYFKKSEQTYTQGA